MMAFLLADLFIWILIFGVFSGCVYASHKEATYWNVFLLIFGSAGISWWSGTNPLTWVADNIGALIFFILIFAVIGALYTIFWSWRKRCNRLRDPKALNSWKNENPSASEDDYFSDRHSFKLHPLNHIDFLIHSMLSWPFLLFWDLLHDPITWFGRFLYDLMGGFFHRIAVSISKG